MLKSCIIDARLLSHLSSPNPRLPYDPYILPVTLCHYLDSAKKCLCGRACFSAYLHYIAPLDLHRVAATVTATDKQGSTRASVEVFLCSAKCLRLWRLNH